MLFCSDSPKDISVGSFVNNLCLLDLENKK